jgi:c-di-GMP-binding flagellar brake protein YcgR
MFLDTRPASLDDEHGADPWAEFRVTNSGEIGAHLKRLLDGNVPINVSSPGGSSLITQLWAVDASKGIISFSVDAHQPGLQTLVAGDEGVAVAYQESVKFQFSLHGMVVVRGAQGAALQCSFPQSIYRFQRRSAYRVRAPEKGAPIVRMRHPEKPDLVISMRVLDISIGGCALLLPPGSPAVAEGSDIRGVRVDLDPETRFLTGISIRRASPLEGEGGESLGTRLGVEWLRLDGTAERALQLYIDSLQKRRRMMMMK